MLLDDACLIQARHNIGNYVDFGILARNSNAYLKFGRNGSTFIGYVDYILIMLSVLIEKDLSSYIERISGYVVYWKASL